MLNEITNAELFTIIGFLILIVTGWTEIKIEQRQHIKDLKNYRDEYNIKFKNYSEQFLEKLELNTIQFSKEIKLSEELFNREIKVITDTVKNLSDLVKEHLDWADKTATGIRGEMANTYLRKDLAQEQLRRIEEKIDESKMSIKAVHRRLDEINIGSVE